MFVPTAYKKAPQTARPDETESAIKPQNEKRLLITKIVGGEKGCQEASLKAQHHHNQSRYNNRPACKFPHRRRHQLLNPCIRT